MQIRFSGRPTVLLVAAAPPAEEKHDQYGDPLPPGAIARLGTTRFRTDSKIVYLAVSADRKMIAAGRSLVWQAATGRPIQIGVPPKPWMVQPATQENGGPLVFSPDGLSLAVGASPVRIYDVESGKLQRSCSGSFQRGEKLAYTPDGHFLIGITIDDDLSIWNSNT